MTPYKEGVSSRVPPVQKREETLGIFADVQPGEHQNYVHQLHFLQDFHIKGICQHSSTPTPLAFGNRGVRFEDHICTRIKISPVSAKPRNVF